MDEFRGAAKRLSQSDVTAAAADLLCQEAAIRAVVDVEVGPVGGFLADGRPRILFEAHHFHRYTGGRFAAEHPTISSPVWNRALYRTGAGEFDRLYEAAALDYGAAVSSASWGMFQILGSNYKEAGFDDVHSFVTAMQDSEGAHLMAFVKFCQETGLAAPLRLCQWAKFAAGYNGPSYRDNRYDDKLAASFARRAQGQAAPWGTADDGPLLAIGATGDAVSALQRKLNEKSGITLVVDGAFGRATEIAVMRVQEAAGLRADGIVGPATLKVLG